jgi:hypothetical protein
MCREAASKVMLELLGTYTAENASQARDDAHRCIIASLADPSTYIMDHLLALKVGRCISLLASCTTVISTYIMLLGPLSLLVLM